MSSFCSSKTGIDKDTFTTCLAKHKAHPYLLNKGHVVRKGDSSLKCSPSLKVRSNGFTIIIDGITTRNHHKLLM